MTAGVEIDIVEILVIGLPSSGKSTLMKTISQQTKHEASNWHIGHLEVDANLHVRFLEPPPLPQFDFMWIREIIEDNDVPGFMVVCDSTRPDLFGETIGILQTVVAHHPETPCVLVANKQDHPAAWTAEDIRVGLGIPDELPVLPCHAHDMNSVKEVVLQLLYRIFGV